jgi:hypothetical protein
MANEISLSATLAYEDSEDTEISLGLPAGLLKTITTKVLFHGKIAVTTSEVAIDKGTISTLGYGIFVNRSPDYYIEIRVSTGGTKFCRLDQDSGFVFLKFATAITAPYAIATGGTAQLEYLLLSA